MAKKINIVTLGCSKNLVDSEHLLRQFRAAGWDVVHDSNDDDAQAVIINTCGFILDAKEESIETVMNYIAAKEAGLVEKVYVMGCLTERYRDELEKELPEVDRFFGKFDFKAIMEELKVDVRDEFLNDRHVTTPLHYAYLKVSEGCNRSCAFCAIPGMTGKHVSVPMEDLIEEATNLASQGVKELLLIAQDLTSYGIDLYNEYKLAELVQKISEVEGIEWIKLHYTYPKNFPLDVLDVMRENPKVCNYIDIPFQHASDGVLKNMRRNITLQETKDLITQIRTAVPGVALRTTMIVGFPGETEEEFDKLVEFVKWARFERLGVFTYSEEEDTYAAKHYEDTISQREKDRRADLLMQYQETVSEQVSEEKVGMTMKVIIDREEGGQFVGRTEFDSPEVDGEVYVDFDEQIKIGGMYDVKITNAEMFDLYGELV